MNQSRHRRLSGRAFLGTALALLSLAVVLALLLRSAGCSKPEAPRGVVHMGDARYEPLALRPRDAAPESAEVRTVEHLEPTKKIEPWQVVAQTVRFMPRVSLYPDRDEPALPGLVLNDRNDPKQISIPVSVAPQDVNQVVLGLRCFNRETVQVMLRREGRPVAVSEAISVDTVKRQVTFPFPSLRRESGTIDEVLIRVDSESRTFVLFDVLLQQVPVATFVPTAEPDLVALRKDLDDARHGIAVSSRNPLVAEAEITPETELAFCYGIPENLRLEPPRSARSKFSGKATLLLDVEREGTSLLSERYPLEKSATVRSTWHAASVDLGALGSGPATVTFRLQVDSDLEGLCMVGEARLLSRGSEAPAVLLITSDTHRADHLGTAGDLVVTPTLDALAARGVVFEDCYSATNVTNPSHVSIMTAVHPRDTRIVNNRSPLLDTATTLAEGFRAGGYRTFAALSAHHLMHKESGLGQGFDRMSAPRRADRDSSETLDVLESWLREAEGEPVFVWLHVFDAHSPYEPPEPYAHRYWERGRDPKDPEVVLDLPDRLVPKFLKGLREVDYPYSQYRGEVDYLDQQLARVLEHERFKGGIVAFTADHGESFGQHGVYWDHAELYPDTVHIPLILAWPGSPAGATVETAVSALDVGRTLLDLAGLEDAPLEGRDLRAALDGTFAEAPRFLMSAHGFSAAINSGGWHLILHLRKHHQAAVRDPRAQHQVELYDLRTDPECHNDLVDAEPARAARMREALVNWLNEARDLELRGTGTQTREQEQDLAALGYADAEPVEQGAWFDVDCECEWCQRF